MPRKTINKKPVVKTPRDTIKKRLMEALTTYLGNITIACESLGFRSNSTYYKYYDRDEDFRIHAEACKNRRKDFAESKLDRLIEQENPTAILFYLKTQCKDRGYSEKQEIEMKTDQSINWIEEKTYEINDKTNSST